MVIIAVYKFLYVLNFILPILLETIGSLQVSLLLQFSISHVNFASLVNGGVHQNQIQTSSEIFNWLSILWERGFCHDNPQGTCDFLL